MKNHKLTVIAGPCSIDNSNIAEVYEIADITVKNKTGTLQKAIAGTRVVGLKSRTSLETTGDGMGIDYDVYVKNNEILLNGGSIDQMEIMPSAIMAEEIHKKTNMIIATEIMNPLVQLPSFINRIAKGKLMPWNPAVNQLGWQIEQMALFARKHGWHIGIKNGKWVGDHLLAADSKDYAGKTTLEKTWEGLVDYVGNIHGDIVLIHRGVDVPEKGDHRNALIHNIAHRVKKSRNVKLYFDPSHSYGPKLRRNIVPGTIEAMKMQDENGEFVYDGILIEVGTSSTDTDQHITVLELKDMVKEMATFRELESPEIIKLKENESRQKFVHASAHF